MLPPCQGSRKFFLFAPRVTGLFFWFCFFGERIIHFGFLLSGHGTCTQQTVLMWPTVKRLC